VRHWIGRMHFMQFVNIHHADLHPSSSPQSIY
jgi:hypothetical protein